MGGMTDKQFKALIREYQHVAEEILQAIKENKTEEAQKKTEEFIKRLDRGLQS